MKNNFNLIAPVYDGLAKVVFGKKLKQIQIQFLPLIPENASVLIMGGGTGWIINELFNTGFKGKLTYVEASEKMISLSRRNSAFNDSIDFIHGEENAIPIDHKYDVIITNFFLDVFSEPRLDQVMSTLSGKLHNGGMWICSDFYDTKKTRHRFLLWLMFSFFRITAKLESESLINFDPKFKKRGHSRSENFTLMNGLIFSSVYTSEQ
ncbi:class I SAM-dependent methyltransferase [Roseivirga sp.]|uniref:class I SAM-dependent methyltransferase n=1 Tax=Roseivirga sp. TaxID=1964215 RepID=UPI002B26FD4F|nr:class I SAM-dependent methyltransferase [Roseivirga sp.]